MSPRGACLAAVVLLAAGCASALSSTFERPKMLDEARAACGRITAGPAAAVDSAIVAEAKQVLAEAEAALGNNWEYVVVDKAYVALRKCELIETKAAKTAAIQKLNIAQTAVTELEAARPTTVK